MKRIILLLSFALVTGTGCKKESLDKGGCYECRNVDPANTARYVDMGCMNAAEWKAFQLSDYNGNDTDKYRYCRKK